jgi:hypothetical protein
MDFGFMRVVKNKVSLVERGFSQVPQQPPDDWEPAVPSPTAPPGPKRRHFIAVNHPASFSIKDRKIVMVEDEKVRQLCVRAVRSRGVDFQLALLELYSVLSEHFDAPRESSPDSSPFAKYLRDALHKPPDA